MQYIGLHKVEDDWVKASRLRDSLGGEIEVCADPGYPLDDNGKPILNIPVRVTVGYGQDTYELYQYCRPYLEEKSARQ